MAASRRSRPDPEDFPDPHDFVPARYEQPRQEDLLNRWTWIRSAPAGIVAWGAFAIMQIKRSSRCCCASMVEMAPPPKAIVTTIRR